MYIIIFAFIIILLFLVSAKIPKEQAPPPPPIPPSDGDLIAAMVTGNYKAAHVFFKGRIQIVKVSARTETRRNHPEHPMGVNIKQGYVVESVYEEFPLNLCVRWSEEISAPNAHDDNEFYYCFIDSSAQYNDSTYELLLDSLGDMSIAPIKMSDAEGYIQKRHEVDAYIAYLKEQERLLAME